MKKLYRLSYDRKVIAHPASELHADTIVGHLILHGDYDVSLFHLTVKFVGYEFSVEKSFDDAPSCVGGAGVNPLEEGGKG